MRLRYLATTRIDWTRYRAIAGLIAGLLATLGGVGVVRVGAHEEIFVTNYATNSILVFPRNADGNTAPVRILQGPATGLSGPRGIAVDTVNNELVVENRETITVYSVTADGNTAPLRTLNGPCTGLNYPANVAVDPVNNELLVTNLFGCSVAVYVRTADGKTPLRTLEGPATRLELPHAVAVDTANNELFVLNASSITVYPRTASSNTPPLRTLKGPGTGLSQPSNLVVDPVNDELVVADLGIIDAFLGVPVIPPSIRVYPRTADGNTPPLRVLQGPALFGPLGLVIDTQNDELLVVKNRSGLVGSTDSSPIGSRFPPSVLVYSRTAEGDTAPLRILNGAATGLTTPQFLAVTPRLAAPAQHMLTVAEAGSGTGTVVGSADGVACGSSCGGTHPDGTVVVLTANPAPDSTFDQWTGGCGGSSPCTLVMTSDVQVLATFTQRPALEVFVLGFFQNVLGRVPDASEIAAWVEFLRRHSTPDGVRMLVAEFFNKEILDRSMTLETYVRLLYRTVLQREPSDAEVRAWIDRGLLPVLNGLVPGFIGSAEFQNLLRVTPASQIISRFYQNVLGRAESPAENAGWVSEIARTGNWQGLALDFLNRPEYVNAPRSLSDRVALLYRTFLGRDPDPPGLSGWLDFLAASLTTIHATFTGSPEFQARYRTLFP